MRADRAAKGSISRRLDDRREEIINERGGVKRAPTFGGCARGVWGAARYGYPTGSAGPRRGKVSAASRGRRSASRKPDEVGTADTTERSEGVNGYAPPDLWGHTHKSDISFLSFIYYSFYNAVICTHHTPPLMRSDEAGEAGEVARITRGGA